MCALCWLMVNINQPTLVNRFYHGGIQGGQVSPNAKRSLMAATCSHRWEVTTGPQGSGILRSMVEGNGLIFLAEEHGNYERGEAVWVEPFPM
jgi:molybdopterin biosynthesis enzyme